MKRKKLRYRGCCEGGDQETEVRPSRMRRLGPSRESQWELEDRART